MVHQRLRRAAALFVIMLAACSGPDAMAPVPAEQEDAALLRDLLGSVIGTTTQIVQGTLNAVPRLIPTLQQTTVSQAIGPAGGVIKGGGVELHVPQGALQTTTTITLVVPVGLYHEVQFYPHGLRFQKPVKLRFELGSNVTNQNLVGTYFTLPLLQGLIRPAETFDATLTNGGVEFWIEHFSRYAPAFRGYTAAGG
jgi:hypothetical protein